MSALIVDTSSWIAYFAGQSDHFIDEALREARLYLPPIVVAELLSGKMNARARRALEELLADLPLCATDYDHWVRTGRLRARLAEQGLSVSTPDAHVAQCALDLDAELLTEDQVFSKISQRVPLRVHG